MNFAYYFHWLILIALVLVYVKVAADEFLDCGKFKNITKRITLLESYSGLKPISNNCKHPIIIANCITYEKETYTKVVTKEVQLECCIGYEYIDLTNECRPKCMKYCTNADCTGPDVWTCHNGYKKLTEWKCIPDCNDLCNDSQCVRPGECDCHNGYKKNEQGGCDPDCDIQCINGFCVDVDKCECNEGYKLKDNETVACEPICAELCACGKCISPDLCDCTDEGYEKTSDSAFSSTEYCDNCTTTMKNLEEEIAAGDISKFSILIIFLCAVVFLVVCIVIKLAWNRYQRGDYYINNKAEIVRGFSFRYEKNRSQNPTCVAENYL